MIMDRIALILTIIGALNWGSIGLFRFDIVAWIFGGQDAGFSRVIYTLVALAGIWCISSSSEKGTASPTETIPDSAPTADFFALKTSKKKKTTCMPSAFNLFKIFSIFIDSGAPLL